MFLPFILIVSALQTRRIPLFLPPSPALSITQAPDDLIIV